MGDWIVDFDGTYKVYGDRIFHKTYQRSEGPNEVAEGEGAEGGVVSVRDHDCCCRHVHAARTASNRSRSDIPNGILSPSPNTVNIRRLAS